jgi:hypothetical protein
MLGLQSHDKTDEKLKSYFLMYLAWLRAAKLPEGFFPFTSMLGLMRLGFAHTQAAT